MASKKFIKLGEKAESFQCPTTGITVLKGEVVAINLLQSTSKKISMALKGGHLEKATEEEYDNFISGVKVINKKNDKPTIEEIGNMNKAAIRNLIDTEFPDHGNNLSPMSKSDLLDLYSDLLSEEEEEEDQED
jgi:hypothetical protein